MILSEVFKASFLSLIGLLLLIDNQIHVVIGMTVIFTVIWLHHSRSSVFAHNNGQDLSIKNTLFDFGAVITGSIGMGKSTLRLHLLKNIAETSATIINFDYKGETKTYLRNPESVIIPGKNLGINVFDSRIYHDLRQYSSQLSSFLIETSNDLSPPQENLLKQAVNYTLVEHGDLDSFISNIILLGLEFARDEEIGSVYTPLALINRLSWFHHDLGSIFGAKKSNLIPSKRKENQFYDLSYLQSNTSSQNVQIFIETILFLLSINSSNNGYSIFIEEAQLLFKDINMVNKTAEIITTLRHRNFQVYLIGTRVDLFPTLLLDSGTIIQFHSVSRSTHHLFNHNRLRELKKFEFLISSPNITQDGIFNLFRFYGKIQNEGIKLNPVHIDIINTLNPKAVRTRIYKAILQRHFQFMHIKETKQVSLVDKTENLRQVLRQEVMKYPQNYDPIDIVGSILWNSLPDYLEAYMDMSLLRFYKVTMKKIQYFTNWSHELQKNYILSEIT